MINAKAIASLNLRIGATAAAIIASRESWTVRQLAEELVMPGLMNIGLLFQIVERLNVLTQAQWLRVNCQWVIWQKSIRDKTRAGAGYRLRYAAKMASLYLAGGDQMPDVDELNDLIGEIWLSRQYDKKSSSDGVRHEILPLVIQESEKSR